MRIAIYTSTNTRRGGVETYLARLLSQLHARDCAVALVHENDSPSADEELPLPPGTPSWSAARLDRATILERVRAWQPDVLYSQGGTNVELESSLVTLAPSVLFAHNYYGTCISGTKAVRYPERRPCDRTFGPACLVHYYPQRCGGLNPATMIRLYDAERRRLAGVRAYDVVVTASEHMRREYLRHGLDDKRVRVIPFSGPALAAAEPRREADRTADSDSPEPGRPGDGPFPKPWSLLFAGRMEAPKGGDLLLHALPMVTERLRHPIRLTLAGTGRLAERWRRAARRVAARDPRIQVEFTGWLSDTDLGSVLAAADLLVVPSVWPEPFGLIGLEAAAHGVPAVAFDVGGIREWLDHGVNGLLARGRPPTADGLATAIVSALGDEATHRRLRGGALDIARRWADRRHVDELLDLFASVAAGRAGATGGVTTRHVVPAPCP